MGTILECAAKILFLELFQHLTYCLVVAMICNVGRGQAGNKQISILMYIQFVQACKIPNVLQAPDQPQPRFTMSPENFLAQNGPRPLDEEEIQEAVRALLVTSAPPALIRIIGRAAYDA